MIFFKKIFAIIILTLSIPIFALSDDKIVFIDLDVVIKNSNLGNTVILDLEKIDKQNVDFLKKNEIKLKKEEEELKKKMNIISKEEFDKEVKLLKTKLNELNLKKNEMVKNYKKEKNSQLNNFFKKVNPVIQKYMDDQSINILLNKKNVIIGKSSSDISKDIIKLINEKFK